MGRELAPCGTHAAYKRHRRRGEEACGPCREAAAEFSRVRRARDAVRHAAVLELKKGRDADVAVVAQHVGYGAMVDISVPVFTDPLEAARWRLERVRAAMVAAGPRDVAPLARADADIVALIEELTEQERRAEPSALDQLASKRAARLRER